MAAWYDVSIYCVILINDASEPSVGGARSYDVAYGQSSSHAWMASWMSSMDSSVVL